MFESDTFNPSFCPLNRNIKKEEFNFLFSKTLNRIFILNL